MFQHVQTWVFLLWGLILTFARPVSLCESHEQPLLLSPYLKTSQVDKARQLSKVDGSCLEDFVPPSYSGYLTADEALGNHLFFWFFPCTERQTAPLLLWLNGGPTVSSMLGLFWENGPLEIIDLDASKHHCGEGMEATDSGYRKRKYSWTKHFSMLYVDNPVGVGFSFSDSGQRGQRATEEGYTGDLVSFLKQFVQLFPEFKARPIYLGGQSYAGKYVSALAYNIHLRMQEGESDLNLTGIYLGAPYFDPRTQREGFNDYLYNMGVFSHHTMLKGKRMCREFYAKAETAGNAINESVLKKFENDWFQGFYNGGSLDNVVSREVPEYWSVQNLMERPEIKRALHVGNVQFVILGGRGGISYKQSFDLDSFLISTKTKMAELMNNYKVLIFNGDFDIIVSTPSIEMALMTTPWKFQEDYNTTERSAWKLGKDNVGYYSLTHKFCRVVIRGSGHQVPHDQPEASFVMMQQFIDDGCVSNTQHLTVPMTDSSTQLSNLPSQVFQKSLILFVLARLL